MAALKTEPIRLPAICNTVARVQYIVTVAMIEVKM